MKGQRNDQEMNFQDIGKVKCLTT